MSVAKTSKNRNFDARAQLFIAVSRVIQVLGGLQMVEMSFRSGRDVACGSVECDSEKEVGGESIVVLSSKGHFGRTQT